jgi:hypothetical protein
VCAEEVQWTDLDYARVHLNSTLYSDVHVKLNTVLLWQKSAFNRKKTLFTNKLDINLQKKLVKCYV